MGQLTPEGIVLDKCKDMLKKLEFMGWVRHYERMNVGMVMNMQGYRHMIGRPGSADIWAFVPVDEIMWIMFLEIKRPDGGKQSDSQKDFEKKFLGFANVIYAIITDAKQIKKMVEEIRSKAKDYGKIPDGILPETI